MPVTNIVEAVLGRKHLKWDALWLLFAWLLDAQEGHALGNKVVDEFCRHAFGRAFESCKLKREYQLSIVKDGKGKWPPGGRRKLDNLASYRCLAREQFPLAIIRAVVLTNAYDGSSMSKMYDGLGSEALDFTAADGWKLLPLRLVGDWVKTALTSSASPPPEKMRLFLLDFVEWSNSLDHVRILPAPSGTPQV
jgi:hypothetical protein